MVSPQNKLEEKMKYYSELTKQAYDTEEDCVNAEKIFAEEEAKKKEEASNLSKEKKELAKAIELTDEELDKAYHEYNDAREKASKILSGAEAEAGRIISEARDKVKAAQRKRYEAISNFNNKFGVYTTHYDGEKALQELRRSTEWINNVFQNLFW